MSDTLSEYELRKLMLSCMDDKELRSMSFNKKKEASSIRVEEIKLPLLEALSDWLSLPYEMVFNSYLVELRSDCNEVVNIMDKEIKNRNNPWTQIDLKELKASVPIADVVRYYQPSYGVKRWSSNIKCPFHPDGTASLHVYEKTNTWQCFGCQKGWTAIDFIIHSDWCSMRDAIMKLKTFV